MQGEKSAGLFQTWLIPKDIIKKQQHTIHTMAEPKTQKTKQSVSKFLASIEEDEKRKDSKTLLKIFTDTCKEKAAMLGPAIIGFGTFHYQSEKSKQAGD